MIDSDGVVEPAAPGRASSGGDMSTSGRADGPRAGRTGRPRTAWFARNLSSPGWHPVSWQGWLVLLVAVAAIVAVVVIVILALLGPAIGNIFSNVVKQI